MKKLKIRKDRTPQVLRKLAKDEPDARVSRRLLAIANALAGMSRTEAARSAGMDRQTLRDWIIRYNEHGVDGLDDNWNGGRLTRDDLVAIAKKKFRKSMHPASMGRLLRRLGLSRQKARPSHPMKDPAAAAAFKKSPANTGKIQHTNKNKRLRLFFQDEARIGQKGRVCHIWWKRGERPPGMLDQRKRESDTTALSA